MDNRRMNRRTMLKATAAFAAAVGFNRVLPASPAPPPQQPTHVLHRGLVGCIGQSIDLEASNSLLDSLEHFSKALSDWHGCIRVIGRQSVAWRGGIPEFRDYQRRFKKDGINLSTPGDLLHHFAQTRSNEFFDKDAPAGVITVVGIGNLFSHINYGEYTAILGDTEGVWLMADNDDSAGRLHVIDMRKALGLIFFCPTPEIWRTAIDHNNLIQPYIPADQVIIEMPDKQAWRISDDFKVIRKFRITKTKYYCTCGQDDCTCKA